MFTYFTMNQHDSITLLSLMLAFLLLILLKRINRPERVRITAFNHGYKAGEVVKINGLDMTVRDATRDTFYVDKLSNDHQELP